jgi:hypothetical protein
VVTVPGELATGGRGGAPGVASGAALSAVLGANKGALGIGCRGPERICPGRGAGGMGRAGIAGIALAGRGAIGVAWPLASGGRKG